MIWVDWIGAGAGFFFGIGMGIVIVQLVSDWRNGGKK